MLTSILLPLSLLPFAAAHFKLNYPPARGFDEDTLSTFPCGGQNTVSSNRTAWPLTGGPIQLLMGHTASQVEVLIALGNDDTTAFNTVLVPTLQEDGPNNFCLGAVRVPTTIGGVTLAAGMNATIQVVTNGDSGGGGLYNCADVTFTSTPLSTADYASYCMNSTGVSTTALANAATINANGTTIGGNATTSTVASIIRSGTSTATAAVAASSSHAAAPAAATVGAGILGAAAWVMVGVAGLL